MAKPMSSFWCYNSLCSCFDPVEKYSHLLKDGGLRAKNNLSYSFKVIPFLEA
jgi:hypothetical protein